MIKRIFVTLCLLTLASASVHAEESSIKISLGIRNTQFFRPQEITNTPYPLAFRIENTGKKVVGIGQARDLFFNGFIHVLSKDGKTGSADCMRFRWEESYGIIPPDLKPGDIFENKIIVNLLDFFPFMRDGDYRVWWTIGGLKSNVLHFTVTDGKLQLVDERPDHALQPTPGGAVVCISPLSPGVAELWASGHFAHWNR
jgi:hypothetical protein